MFDALSEFFKFINGQNASEGLIIFESVLVMLLILGAIIFLFIKFGPKLRERWLKEAKKVMENEEYTEKVKKHEKAIEQLNDQIEIIKTDVETTKNDIKETKVDISNIKDNIGIMIDKLDGYIQKDNERTVIQYRNSLWRIHKDLLEKGYATPTDLKNVNEMAEEYSSCGGNDIVHSKLLPEIMNLPVKYDEIH